MLDHMSNGRVILGLGRGLGRIEFEGFGVDMNTSRERFVESAEMILSGLERGWCEYDGKYVKQVRRDIRPRPHTTFRGRIYAAAVSPESFPIMARLGLGLCIIPQKPWDIVAARARHLPGHLPRGERQRRAAADRRRLDVLRRGCGPRPRHGRGATSAATGAPSSSTTSSSARTCRRPRATSATARMQEIVSAPGGVDAMTEFFLDLQVWGTPEQCYEKIMTIRRSPAPAPTTACSATPACRTRRPSAACGCSRATCCRACRRSTTCPSASRARQPRKEGGGCGGRRVCGGDSEGGWEWSERGGGGVGRIRAEPVQLRRCGRAPRQGGGGGGSSADERRGGRVTREGGQGERGKGGGGGGRGSLLPELWSRRPMRLSADVWVAMATELALSARPRRGAGMEAAACPHFRGGGGGGVGEGGGRGEGRRGRGG